MKKKLLYVAAIVALITYFIFGAPVSMTLVAALGVALVFIWISNSFNSHPQVKNTPDGKFKTFSMGSIKLIFNTETGKVSFSGSGLYRIEVFGGNEVQKQLYSTPGQEFDLWKCEISSDGIYKTKRYTNYKSGTATGYVNGQTVNLNVSVPDGGGSYEVKTHNAISVKLFFEPDKYFLNHNSKSRINNDYVMDIEADINVEKSAGYVLLGLGQVNDHISSEAKSSFKQWFNSLEIDQKVKQHKEQCALEIKQLVIEENLTKVSKDNAAREKEDANKEKARNSLHQILQKYSFERDDDKTKYLFWRTDDRLEDFIVLHPTQGLIVGRNGQVEWAGSIKGAKVEKLPQGGIIIIVRDAEYENAHDRKKRIKFFDNPKNNNKEYIDEWSDRIELLSER
jgi:hypothetical protein